MRILGIVSYDGGAYYGWQRQPDQPTVQQEVERVLSIILDTSITIFGSGRTDAGVHAYGQTFHFDVDKPFDLNKLIIGFNALVSKDIHLRSLKRVPPDFHARHHAKSKTYFYLINNGEYSPFQRQFAMQIRAKLDVTLMKQAATLLIGRHNFQDFTTKEEDQDSFIRLITHVAIKSRQGLIRIDVIGSGFMTYMVRFIVGTLIAIGLHRETPAFITNHLDQPTRAIISYKAEAFGLYLYKVAYR